MCVLSVSLYHRVMAGALAEQTVRDLRAALDEVLRASPLVPTTVLSAFGRLVDVLETGADAVVFAADATVSTQQAAVLLGVSRMTVVRLVDRGELATDGGAVHRRISVSELERYRAENARRRASAVVELANDIDEATPPDEVVKTR